MLPLQDLGQVNDRYMFRFWGQKKSMQRICYGKYEIFHLHHPTFSKNIAACNGFVRTHQSHYKYGLGINWRINNEINCENGENEHFNQI